MRIEDEKFYDIQSKIIFIATFSKFLWEKDRQKSISLWIAIQIVFYVSISTFIISKNYIPAINFLSPYQKKLVLPLIAILLAFIIGLSINRFSKNRNSICSSEALGEIIDFCDELYEDGICCFLAYTNYQTVQVLRYTYSSPVPAISSANATKLDNIVNKIKSEFKELKNIEVKFINKYAYIKNGSIVLIGASSESIEYENKYVGEGEIFHELTQEQYEYICDKKLSEEEVKKYINYS